MRTIKVCQICSGDLWAGKENLCAILVRGLPSTPEIESSAVVFNEGRLARELREARVRVDIVDERRMGALPMLRRMKAVLSETRPHLVHAHGYKEHILGAFAARSVGARVVRTFHGMSEPLPFFASVRARAYGRLQRFVTRRFTDAAVVVSQDMERRFQGKTGRARLLQIYNGIEIDRLPGDFDRPGLLRELGLSEEVALVGAVGRLVPVKGLNHLLEAAAIRASERPETHFLIVGDGPLRPELERHARHLGIAERVHFLGHRDDSVAIIGCLDLLAMPSLHEGIPMTLLEAVSIGKPVVASRAGGIVEILETHPHGVLVEAGDAPGLARGIRDLLAAPAPPAPVRETPPAFRDRFASESMVRKYRALYLESLGGAPVDSGDEPAH